MRVGAPLGSRKWEVGSRKWEWEVRREESSRPPARLQGLFPSFISMNLFPILWKILETYPISKKNEPRKRGACRGIFTEGGVPSLLRPSPPCLRASVVILPSVVCPSP